MRRWSRLFLNIPLHFHALELHTQAFDFVPLRAAGYGSFQYLALPATQQGRQNALSTSHVGLPGPGRHLVYALDFERGRIFFAGGGQVARIQFLGQGQWKIRLLAVRFS